MKRSDLVRSLKLKVQDKLTVTEVHEIVELLDTLGFRPPPYMGVFATGKKFNKETDFGRDVQAFSGFEPED